VHKKSGVICTSQMFQVVEVPKVNRETAFAEFMGWDGDGPEQRSSSAP
jgi:hypothetical protein